MSRLEPARLSVVPSEAHRHWALAPEVIYLPTREQ